MNYLVPYRELYSYMNHTNSTIHRIEEIMLRLKLI